MTWFVHLFVLGRYSGCYEFADETSARDAADERYRTFAALGCVYFVNRSTESEMIQKHCTQADAMRRRSLPF